VPAHLKPRAATELALIALALAAAPAFADAGTGAVAGAAPRFEPALLSVTLNGQAAEEPLMLLRDASGGLYATEAQFRQWRMRLPEGTAIVADGERWFRLDGGAAVAVRLDAAAQSLEIQAAPELFDNQRVGFTAEDIFEMTPSGTGGFVNYDLFGEMSGGRIGLSGAIEAGLFTRRGVGSTGFILQAGSGTLRATRLESGWTIDRPESLSSIRIGDGVTAGGVGAAPVRFGGIQYARNFATRPGYLTMPLPVLQGSAAMPSVVDVYVNNILQGSSQVAPGPFELTNVPIQSGGGSVQIVVRDLLGRQMVSEQNYYASSELLRRGVHDFSYEIGFVREGFGARSFGYGAPIATTSHRYGLSDSITLEGQAQASGDLQGAGAGIVAAFFGLGQVGASAAVSRTHAGTGFALAGSFERRGQAFSIGARADYSSEGYAFIGMGDDLRPPRLSVQAFGDLQLLGGSIGFNVIHRDRRDGDDDESVAGLFANLPLGDRVNAQLFARRTVSGERQTVVGAHLSIALGDRRSASVSSEYGRDNGFSNQVSIQSDPRPGVGGSWRAAASLAGGRRTVESVYTWNAAPTTVTAHVSNAGGESGFRLSARGAIGLIGGSTFASRQLGQSFARVQVGRFPGVRVYADNQLVGTTGADGIVVVPALRAFDRNMVRIEEADLPLDVRITENERLVRPFARSGAIVAFAARRERGVLLQVALADGTLLPPGALVRVVGSNEDHVVVTGGAVYLPDLQGSATLEARWNGERCTFQAVVPEGDDPQPRLSGLVCTPAPIYAGR
jgi:outer membrane usher protein